MAIFATLPGPDLFSTLPTTPPPSNHSSRNPPPKPPIPVPKYPPPLKKNPKQPPISPAFKTHHQNSKYFKPIKPGQKVSRHDTEDRSVIVGNSGISYQLPGAPFEFMYSYSETPKAQPVALREPAFLPFAPPTMPRPWTGKAPMKKSKRNIKLFEPLGGVENNDGRNLYQKRYEMLRSYELGNISLRPREEVLGEPLTRWEIKELLKRYLSSNRQVNLGRDGLTHNMLELIHTHWRRQPVCKVRCLGVPTVDMDNICRCLEERAGGKIIHRAGGVVYIFRGRNYDHQKRPKLPVMLWKPAAPVYPKLVQDAPEGLTKEEADNLRKKGKNLLPICKLAKNGVYISLVTDVRTAFEGSILVKINCKGLDPSDYKKIGAKLKELVPCVLLSFDDEHILMWRGKEWKSMYIDTPNLNFSCDDGSSLISKQEIDRTPLRKTDAKSVSSSPKMMSLWQRAIESGKASVLDEIELTPDDLLSRVEEFDLTTQAMEHSYPATIHSNKRGSDSSDPLSMDLEDDGFRDDDGKIYINDSFDTVESSVPLGSLPVDFIAKRLIVGQGEV